MSDLPNASVPSASLDPVAEDALVLAEWTAVADAAPPVVRQAVAAFVSAHLDELADRYTQRTLADPEAARFIATEASVQEVGATVRRWLLQLLCDDAAPLGERVARQRLAGEALARVSYPMQAVARGARKLRAWIIAGLEASALTGRETLQAAAYVSDLLDISIELRTASYLRDSARQSRIDEAYRMHSLGQNIAMERERQRASLMEWSHGVLVDLHRSLNVPLPRLGASEFGLWLSHKAATLFEGAPEVGLIAAAVERIDRDLLPQLDPSPTRTDRTLGDSVEQLQTDLAAIKYNVAGLFEQHIEVESGRDTLTRLLNRRFLSTVLAREIALYRRAGEGTFSVLILDIDHFKRINDTHGHDGGDAVLQQAAALVVASVRPSDFVFRYGGEEILVVLVESDAAIAAQVAENVRQRVEAASFALSGSGHARITVSIGIAQYQGRPDFQPLLAAADAALYRAKNAGRNRVEIA